MAYPPVPVSGASNIHLKGECIPWRVRELTEVTPAQPKAIFARGPGAAFTLSERGPSPHPVLAL